MEAIDKIKDFVNVNRWRTAFMVLIVIFAIHIMLMNKSLESFSQGPDPTMLVTLYYKPNCPACKAVEPHWVTLVKNLKTDGRIRSQALDCSNPANAADCLKNNPSGLLPALVKTQASGRTHLFKGNHYIANYYDFANRDY